MSAVANLGIETQVLPIGIEDSAEVQSKGEPEASAFVMYSSASSMAVGSLSSVVSIVELALGESPWVFGIYGAVGLVELSLGIRSIRLVHPTPRPISRADLCLVGLQSVLSVTSVALAWFYGDRFT